MTMMTLQIPSEWLTEIEQLFTKHLSDVELWAYGSRVQGKAHAGSDLDLMVKHPIKPDNMTCENLTDFREALRDSNLPVMVDVMDYARIPNEFKTEFERDSIRLF